MTEFVASNSASITTADYGTFRTALVKTVDNSVSLAGVHVEALREFFQHERDEELGRWRWAAHPHYVVYTSRRPHLVLNELTGDTLRTSHEDPYVDNGFGTIYNAAAAYFESHPERKPWHDAKPGETWRLTVKDRDSQDMDLTFNVIGVENAIGVRFARPQVSGEQMEYPITSDAIVGGRRIWPEESS